MPDPGGRQLLDDGSAQAAAADDGDPGPGESTLAGNTHLGKHKLAGVTVHTVSELNSATRKPSMRGR